MKGVREWARNFVKLIRRGAEGEVRPIKPKKNLSESKKKKKPKYKNRVI